MTNFEIALIGIGVMGVILFIIAKFSEHLPHKHKHA